MQVTSVVKASYSTYQIKWREETYRQGSRAATEYWTAMLTVITQTPRTVDVLRKNPLGIYVNAVAWTQEVNTAGSKGGE